MIIVEGFDCSGKSTLATILGKAKGWPVVHTGGPPGDVHEVAACLALSKQRMAEPVVQDRVTHISEAAYSFLRSPARAALALSRLADLAPPVCIVYCRPPTEYMLNALTTTHSRKFWDTEGHLTYVGENAKAIISFYDMIMQMIRLRINNVITFDHTDESDNLERLIYAITRWHQ